MMSKPIDRFPEREEEHIELPDGATVVVVGGGPSGSFFAIQAARKVRRSGKHLNILILEKKDELRFYQAVPRVAIREGCNCCAGGISPRLADALGDNGLRVPEGTVMGEAEALIMHADWKSIELPMPEGREMFSVFRGSRPRHRPGRHLNFDSYLLDTAVSEGARVITGEVCDIRYSSIGKPVVSYRIRTGEDHNSQTIEADFVAFAGGVNPSPGTDLNSSHLVQTFREIIPGFRPPRVRKTLIFEVESDEESLRCMKGEMHFVQYGSKDLRIEMSSLMPKGGLVTVVLIGTSVDRASPSQYREVLGRFLELPHIKRLLPRSTTYTPICACSPNMVVGACRNPFGHRMALVGDMVVSRLYKDGIFSAYATATALAECILDVGIDRVSLKKHYQPAVKEIDRDNKLGAVVFLFNRVMFSRPILSRIFYQAVMTERKTKAAHKRRLGMILWGTASGDDDYRSILLSMCHPATAWTILVGGVLVTIRNYVAEKLLGLRWEGFGRYPTGVPREDVGKKRGEITQVLNIPPPSRPPEFERTYSIKIRADQASIFREVGEFGEGDCRYFRPRMVKIRRTIGRPNEVGSTVQYDLLFKRLSFHVDLEKVVGKHYLLYRVRNGFARGGVLAFDIDEKDKGSCILSIYVAFDFPVAGNFLKRLCWHVFRLGFPAFVHDVVWNHSLCRLKHFVETDE